MEPKGKPARQQNFDLRDDTKLEAARNAVSETPDGPFDIEKEGPQPSEQDWDELSGAPILTENESGNKEIDRDGEKDGELPEEDDDNPDQESDEALPDDQEEQAIRHDLAGSGIRYEPE